MTSQVRELNQAQVKSNAQSQTNRIHCYDCLNGYDHLNMGTKNQCPSVYGVTFTLGEEIEP